MCAGEWRSLVARLLWEQDAAGSNPVSPMRSETSPQLVFKPSRKGRFFLLSLLKHAASRDFSVLGGARNPKVPILFQVADADTGAIN